MSMKECRKPQVEQARECTGAECVNPPCGEVKRSVLMCKGRGARVSVSVKGV